MVIEEELEEIENLIDGDSEKKNLGFFVSKLLHEKIKKHVYLRKILNKDSTTQKKWVANAIKEKLKREELNNLIKAEPPQIFFMVNIPKEDMEKIDRTVNLYKEVLKTTYSRKKWILDAIEEQLDNEKQELEKDFKDLQN